MPNWKKVIVSGSNATLNSLNVINGITGSLLGTSSYATYAESTSNVLGGSNTYVPVWSGSNTLVTGSIRDNRSNQIDIFSGTNNYGTVNISAVTEPRIYLYSSNNDYLALYNSYGQVALQYNPNVGSSNNLIRYSGYDTKTTTLQTNGQDRITISNSGSIRFNKYTTDGLLKTTGSDGTIVMATASVDYVIPSTLNNYVLNSQTSSMSVATASYAATASNVQGGTQYYVPLWNTNTSLASSYLNQSGSVLKTIYSGQDRGLTLDYNYNSFILGNPGVGNNTYLQVYDGGGVLNIYTPNYTYFNDKVGVRIIPTNPGLAVSGSLEVTGPGLTKFTNTNVQITGSLGVTGGITGSLFGTSSWAVSASSALYAVSASSTLTSVTASHAVSALSASYSISSSYAILATTASHAVSALSSSYSISSSYAVLATTASLAQNTSNILVYVKNQTGTQIDKGKVVRISGAVGDNPLIETASYTNDNNSANTLGVTYENIANGDNGYVMTEGTLLGIDTSTFSAGQLLYLGDTGSIIGTAPQAPLHAVRLGQVLRVQLNNGSMYVRIDNGYELGELHDVRDNTTTGSYGDLLVKSGSVWINSRQLTGSYGLTGSLTSTNGGFTGSLKGTSSFAIEAITASYSDFFTVRNNAIISGSLIVNQDLIVYGSASITYITQSNLNIATNLITVNTNTPAIRFGGLAVIDSGSSPISSGSFLYDSVQDEFIFVHKSDGINVTSSHFLLGPETLNNLGNETYLTLNRIPKSRGNEHLNDSQISDDGTTVSIPGKLSVTGGITGSLLGTATNAVSASFATNANNALSASAASIFNVSSSLYSAQGATAGLGTTVITSISTGSYRAGFFDYTVYNNGNARAGTVMSVWNGSTVKYTDTSTTDIGATNSVTMSAALNGGNVELRTTAGTTWTVQTTYRLI